MPQEMMLYHWWAKNFHYTPKQVREEVDIDCFVWFPVIESAIAKVQTRVDKEAQRANSAPTTQRRVLGR